MASFKIVIERQAAKQLRKLSAPVRKRVVEAIDALAVDPDPLAARKMIGSDAMRLRVGDYRVIYRIDHHVVQIFVIRVGHRREVYR